MMWLICFVGFVLNVFALKYETSKSAEGGMGIGPIVLLVFVPFTVFALVIFISICRFLTSIWKKLF